MNQRPTVYTFQRYLLAKRTVDDRALNRYVWDALHQQLASRAADGHTLTILEVGGGIGTMVERLIDDGRLPLAHYHMLDEQADNIAVANQRLQRHHASHARIKSQLFNVPPTHAMSLGMPSGHAIHASLYAYDVYDFLAHAGPLAATDLILAHAFMDLVDIPATLPRMTATLRPGTLLYFTINFDGVTIFEPAIDAAFDAHIEQLYHRTMDERIINGQPSGDSHTGRHLFHYMQAANIRTLNVGSSDWVIVPLRGIYPHDEAYFLHFIIHTLHGALRTHPELDAVRFEAWIAQRHAQVERGELIYIAHQLDYLGELQATSNSGASIATSHPSA